MIVRASPALEIFVGISLMKRQAEALLSESTSHRGWSTKGSSTVMKSSVVARSTGVWPLAYYSLPSLPMYRQLPVHSWKRLGTLPKSSPDESFVEACHHQEQRKATILGAYNNTVNNSVHYYNNTEKQNSLKVHYLVLIWVYSSFKSGFSFPKFAFTAFNFLIFHFCLDYALRFSTLQLWSYCCVTSRFMIMLLCFAFCACCRRFLLMEKNLRKNVHALKNVPWWAKYSGVKYHIWGDLGGGHITFSFAWSFMVLVVMVYTASIIITQTFRITAVMLERNWISF